MEVNEMKNILSELTIVCLFAAMIFAGFMGMASTAGAETVFGIAALVSGVAFVVSLIVEASKMGLKV